MEEAAARFEEVRAIALGEMLAAAQAERTMPAAIARRLFDVPASALASSLVALDRDLAGGSLRRAGLRRLAHYRVAATIDGVSIAKAASSLPQRAPLLVLSNHPGIYDALILFAGIAREDLTTLAARRPLFDALPNLAARLLMI